MSSHNLVVQVKKKYKNFHIDLDFKMNHGVLGILGASGCGKTLTLKMIAGLVNPDSGRVSFNEEVYYDSNKKINLKPQIRKAGYLFQNYALFPNMTVSQNIQAGMSDSNTNNLRKLISKFKLEGLENHYPSQLSGGQQQRVGLARILAYKPKIMLLDEPFSAMDSFLKDHLRLELLKVLKEYDGLTIIVSHDRDEIYQLCDSLILMDNGKIVEMGHTKELFEHPKTVVGARLTGCKNISKIEWIDGTHVKCLDFNDVILEVANISQDCNYIAIRAHDFTFNHLSTNNIKVNLYEVSELPFEWQIVINDSLTLKCDKHMDEHQLNIPKYISIPTSKIIGLKDSL